MKSHAALHARLWWACVATILLALPPVRAAERSLEDLTGPWQLLIDDFAIAEKSGLVRRYHAFTKDPRNPVSPEMGSRGSYLPGPDGKGYRKWHSNTVYTSADGIAWSRTKLQMDFERMRGNPVVFHTPWDKGREYKMFGFAKSGNSDPRFRYGRFGSCSSDGIHWVDLKNNPVALLGGDTGLSNWDPLTRRYISTPKLFAWTRGATRRAVAFSAGTAFDAGWSVPELVLVPDAFDDRWVTQPGQRTEFYNLSAFAYETMYIGLLEVFHNTDGWKDGHIFIEVVSSRDGLHWKREEGDRPPVLPLGPAGAWDCGMIKVPSHPLVEDGAIKLFYAAGNYPHSNGRKEYASFGEPETGIVRGVGLAMMRKDGFASLDAGADSGTLLTHVIQGAGETLAVNYAAKDGGWLKAAILDGAGNPVPGYTLEDCEPLKADSTNAPVAWRKQHTLPSQDALRIQFQLQNASLYSFNAGPVARISGQEPVLGVLHTFEGGDAASPPSDRLTADGAQPLHFYNAVVVDNDKTQAGKESAAAFGLSEVIFPKNGEHARMLRTYASHRGQTGDPWSPVTWNAIEIERTHRLGHQFTLAAMIKVAKNHRARLFSSWDPYLSRAPRKPGEPAPWIGSDELALDFDASGKSQFGCVRLAVHGQEVSAPGLFRDDSYQHLAVTYDDGAVRLYLNGAEIGRGAVAGGPVALLANLHVGGNPGPQASDAPAAAPAQQFEGLMDDILVLGRALTPDEIKAAGAQGAEIFFNSPPLRRKPE